MAKKKRIILKYGTATVDEDCPQLTIDLLNKMCEKVYKKSFLSINLKFLRKLNQMSQQQCSEKFKVHRSSIGAYEENRAEPKLKLLVAMSNYYGVTIDDMVKIKIINVPHKRTDS